MKDSIKTAIEKYAKLVIPTANKGIVVDYIGSDEWNITVKVSNAVYEYILKVLRNGKYKIAYEKSIKKEMSKMFPLTFEVFIVLDEQF